MPPAQGPQRDGLYQWVGAFFHSLLEGATRGGRKQEAQNQEEWTRQLQLNLEYICETEEVDEGQDDGSPHDDDDPTSSSEDDTTPYSEDDASSNGEGDGCYNSEDDGCINSEDDGCINSEDDGCINSEDGRRFNSEDDANFYNEDAVYFNNEDGTYFNNENAACFSNREAACFSREDYICCRDENELHFNGDHVGTSDSDDDVISNGDAESSSSSESSNQGARCNRCEDPALPIPKGEFQRSLLEIAKRRENDGSRDTRFLLVKRDYPEPRSLTPISKSCVGISDFERNCPSNPEYSIVVRYEEFSDEDDPSSWYPNIMSTVTWTFFIMTSIPFMLTVILLYVWY